MSKMQKWCYCHTNVAFLGISLLNKLPRLWLILILSQRLVAEVYTRCDKAACAYFVPVICHRNSNSLNLCDRARGVFVLYMMRMSWDSDISFLV